MRGQVIPYCGLFLLLSALLVLGMSPSAMSGTIQPPPGLAALDSSPPIPDFSLQAIDGTRFRAADLQGKVTVVQFWATW